MELALTQRTAEWQCVRRSLCLTASHFADALGLGRGTPYHFLASLVAPQDDERYGEGQEDASCRHGVEFEPVIDRAYRRLTGRDTEPGGFWVAAEVGDPLRGLVGASPDAKVIRASVP